MDLSSSLDNGCSRSTWRLVVVLALLSALIAAVYPRASGFEELTLYKPRWRGQWIKAPETWPQRTYFRKIFQVNGSIANAWVQIAAYKQFVLTINGKNVGSNPHLWSNLNGFRSTVNEPGQRAGGDIGYRVSTNPDVQWTPQREWLVGTLYDITPYLVNGTNLIAVSVQTNSGYPRLIIDGEVQLEDGTTQPLVTDRTWKTNTLAEVRGGLEWNELMFSDTHWEAAVADDGKTLGMPITLVDPVVYQVKPRGHWMSSEASAASRNLYLRRTVFLEDTPEDSWLRVYANHSYDLFINDHRVDLGRTAFRDREPSAIKIIGIKTLLNRGRNIIAINVHPPLRHKRESAPARVFIDGLLRVRGKGETWLDAGLRWRAINQARPGWTTKWFNDSDWQSPVLLPLQTSIRVGKRFYGSEVDYAQSWRQSLLVTSVTFVTLALGTAFVASAALRRAPLDPKAVAQLMALSLVPALALVGTALVLKLRFAVDDTKLWLAQPWVWQTVFVLAFALVGTGLITCWAKLRTHASIRDGLPISPHFDGESQRRGSLADFLHYASLVAVIMGGSSLLLWDLGFEGLQNDESVSVSAALGILESGAPEYPSGVWYTRSPLYHYLLAFFIALLGHTPETVRLPSAITGIAFLVMMYRVACDISSRRTVALLTVGLLAISPWEILMARSARFYILMQLFATAAIYYFIKGFIREHVPKYQLRFFICYTLAFLSQEVVVMLVPAFVVGYLLFAKRFNWRDSKTMVAGLIVFLLIAAIDVITFNVRCLTNLAGVSPGTGSIISPHVINLFGFANELFIGRGHGNILLTVLFLAGLPIWFRRQDRVFVFLFLVVVLTLLVATVLILQVRPRYIFVLHPILILMALTGLFEVLWPKRKAAANGLVEARLWPMKRFVGAFSTVIILGGIVWSQQPIRLWESYSQHINTGGDMQAIRFVSSQRGPNDLLITGHSQTAIFYSQRVNYYLVGRVAFDEIFRKDGVLIDRWGGGELIDSVDKLRYVLERAERAWIVLGDRRITQLDEDLREFLKSNLRLVYQPFFNNVYLWEKSRGMVFMPAHQQRERNLF